MNIGCIYSVSNFESKNKPLNTQMSIPFGISFIATVLKKHDYDPYILVLTPQMNIERILQEFINTYHPSLFCLTATSSQFHLIKRAAVLIKKIDNKIFTILGGVHASLNPEETIRYLDFDALCIGEGEKAIIKLVHCLELGKKPSSIPNLWIKDKETGAIEKNPPEDFIQDLDRLPFIDRTLWYNWINEPDHRFSVLIGRGCPNKCSFCSNHALSQVTKGKYVRLRAPENIVKEISEIVEKNSKVSSIYLEVETISVNLQYAYNLFYCLRKFNENRNIPLEFGINVSPLKKIIENEDFFMNLKEANFTSINIGLESGSERLRKEILRRPQYKNKDIITFCALARKYGIKVMVNVLIGIPGETIDDFHETVVCVRKCYPDNIQLSIFEPYPGTDLYNSCIEQGLFDPENPEILQSERYRAFMDLPGFSKKKIQFEYFLFNFRVWGFRAFFRPDSRVFMIIAWFSDLVFGRLNPVQLLQKIRNKRISKMHLSDFK